MYRKRHVWLIAGFLFSVIAGPRQIEAQFSANYQTNLISGVVSNWSGDYLVGYSNSADALLVLAGGALSNGNAYLGYSIGGTGITSSNDSALVDGAGSRWVSNPGLYIGYSGPNNSLTVSGGALVSDQFGIVGNSLGSSNNSLFITDPGSVLSNGTLTVGYRSAANSLMISNGGNVYASASYVGNGTQTPSASNNQAQVTGPGSLWSTSGSLTVGFFGGRNTMIINGGGQVLSGSGVVGAEFSSSNNTVLVTDVGSVWSNAGSLTIGNNSSGGNSLVISNGGRVANGVGYVGGPFDTSHSNNVLVTGPGSVWSNSGTLAVGGAQTSSNRLVIADGALVVSAAAIVGDSRTSNSVLVTDAGSAWNVTSNMLVGNVGGGNSLTISNSAQVVDNIAYVGNNSGSNNAVRVVGGPGLLRAAWRNNAVYVGNLGSGNSLVIAGGSVTATNLIVGVASAKCDNVLELDSGSLIVTNAARDATLEVRHGQFIMDGGVVRADLLVITNGCAQFVHTAGTLLLGSVILDPNLFHITSIMRQGDDLLVAWLMGPGITNTLQVASGESDGSYPTNGFTDIFVVANNTTLGTPTNYLDIGAATNVPARYYRARLVP